MVKKILIHSLNAWAAESGLVLGHVKTDGSQIRLLQLQNAEFTDAEKRKTLKSGDKGKVPEAGFMKVLSFRL